MADVLANAVDGDRRNRSVGGRWARAASLWVAWGMLAAACTPDHREQTYRESGSGRSYRVVVSPAHSLRTPSAALFLLHGYGTEPDTMVRSYGLIRRAVHERGWLLVLPRGEPDAHGRIAWNASAACCGDGDARRSRDDVAYLRGVLADLRTHFALDARRVYALGVSNGSFMAQRWACTPESGLRAVVSISGAAPGPDDPPCAAVEPPSLLHLHGSDDDIIRYAGSSAGEARYPGARETAALWRGLAHAGARTHDHWRTSLWPFQRVHEERWDGELSRVALWTYHGGGHKLRTLRWEMDALLSFLDGS